MRGAEHLDAAHCLRIAFGYLQSARDHFASAVRRGRKREERAFWLCLAVCDLVDAAEFRELARERRRGTRGPDNPCADFREGTPRGGCSTDGHYRCMECVHCDVDEYRKLKEQL